MAFPTSRARPVTTRYLFVALMEGSVPWFGAFTGQGSIPREGDIMPGGERVLDTYVVARTITFR